METYKGKKVLVTGGTGFIGSRLAERLYIDEQADVKVMVHNWPKAAWVSRLGVELVKADITNAQDVDEAVKGCEIVFHCVGVGGSMEQCMKINVEGTKNVLAACKKHKVKRIVYLSSVVVHGPDIFDGMNEDAPFVKTGDPYADSKIEAEQYFTSFIKENQIEGSVIRPTYVWGPLSLYYTIDIINQLKKGKFLLVDNGIGSCNAVHVDNVVDLSLICGYHPNAVGESFIVTDGEKLNWKEFWGEYARMLNIEIETIPSVPSKDGLIRKFKKYIKSILVTLRDNLTKLVDKNENKSPFLTNWGLKAPRKLVKMALKSLMKHLPEMDPAEVKSFSSIGFISIEKANRLLNYTPQTSVKQGMEDCAVWLKDQNYIQ